LVLPVYLVQPLAIAQVTTLAQFDLAAVSVRSFRARTDRHLHEVDVLIGGTERFAALVAGVHQLSSSIGSSTSSCV
jgi:hypothetical protein